MGRLVVLPVGLSLLRNLQKAFNLQLTPGNETHELMANWERISSHLERLSVELSILKKLGVGSEDTVAFLSTDTDSAESAARANALLAEKAFGLTSQAIRIKGLNLDNAEEFLKKGLHNFFTELDKCISNAYEKGLDPILGIAGGIKAVLPYVAVYGMLSNVPLVYVFEETQALATLPPLPLDFDWEGLRNLDRILRELEQEGVISLARLRSSLGEDFAKWEGLFELEEGHATLSAFGHLLLSKIRRAQDSPVMLSPSAKQKLESLKGAERNVVETLLDRVRNPLWRAQKCHSFSSTDLLVIKPGSTSPRLAICAIKNESVYVAEIYSAHDEYERDLPNRHRNDYDLRNFVPHNPKSIPIDAEIEEEAGGDISLALALNEARVMQKERDEALELASSYEQKLKAYEAQLKEYEQSLIEIREKLAEMEARERERSSWGLWRRLRWALFPSSRIR